MKAIVFDVDGTLYRQRPLRRAMLMRLLAAHAVHPLKGWQTFAALRAYRHAQEELRGAVDGDVAATQIRLACEASRVDRAVVEACVERWMEQEPLELLARFVQPGLVDFLRASRERGIRLAALSDYPPDAKLRALGITRFFDLTLCAQSPEIGVFKPDPRGLRVALERLRTSAAETLFVGDRVDVDAAAARAAGVPCAVLTNAPADPAGTHTPIRSFLELRELLFGAGSAHFPRRGFTQVA